MEAEQLKILLDVATTKRGGSFVALCAMLSRLNGRDVFRMANLIRATAREKIKEVETDIIGHAFFSRADKAENLQQFRRLYARLYDLSAAFGNAADGMTGVEPEDLGEFFADLLTLAVALTGSDVAVTSADMPPSSRSGVEGAWTEPPDPATPYAGMSPGSALT